MKIDERELKRIDKKIRDVKNKMKKQINMK